MRPSFWPLGAHSLVRLMDVYTVKSSVRRSEGLEEPAEGCLTQAKGAREGFPRRGIGLDV